MLFNSVFFNGEDLSQYCKIAYPISRKVIPNVNTVVTKVGTQEGEHMMSSNYNERQISIPVVMIGNEKQNRANIRQLARIMTVSKPQPLIFGDEPDRYWLALPYGESNDLAELADQASGTLNFVTYTPYAIGTKSETHTWDSANASIKFFCNFNNKLTGNLNSNPNSAYVGEDISTNLDNPQFYTQEFSQQQYVELYHGLQPQDSTDVVTNYAEYNASSNKTARIMVKFNLVDDIAKSNPGIWSKYNLGTLSQQVAWIKSNIQYLEFRTWATGAGGSNFQYWNGSDWAGTRNMPQGKPDYWLYQINNQAEINTLIDDYGCCYILISALNNTNSFCKLGYIDVRGGLSYDDKASDNQKSDTITIDYEGTYPAPVDIQLQNNTTDNGFIGVVSDDAIIQIGNPTTPETIDNKHSERLIEDNFDNGVSSQWSVNDAKIFFEPDKTKIDGSWSGATLDQGMPGANDKYRIWPEFKQDSGTWNGPTITQTLKQDSSGVAGACNFICQADTRFSCLSNPKEDGVQELIINSSDGKHLAGISMRDEDDSSTDVHLVLYVGDDCIFAADYPALANFVGKISIQKFGQNFLFKIDKIVDGKDWWHWTYSWNDSRYEKTEAASVSFCDLVYGDHKNLDMGLFYIAFDKMNVDQWVQNPNVFHAQDTINIKCDDYKVETFVNNALSVECQDVGSQPILLKPGQNIIKIAYSSYSNRPDVNLSYTPRYI